MAKRREIMLRRRVDDAYIASWFSFEPVSKPAPKKFAAALTRSKAARRHGLKWLRLVGRRLNSTRHA